MECDSRKQAVNETTEDGVPPRAGYHRGLGTTEGRVPPRAGYHQGRGITESGV